MSVFSRNLRFLRKKANYRQDEISGLFKKQANTIGNWENEKSEPSLNELIKLGEYFKVSVQELLHTDMESQAMPLSSGPGMAGSEPRTGGLKSNSNRIDEAFNSPANDGSQEAFWMILRELRSVHEKVDLLISRMETSNFQKTSDKSSH